MADEDFIINIQPTPNFIVELNEQGPQGPRGPQGVQGDKGGCRACGYYASWYNLPPYL